MTSIAVTGLRGGVGTTSVVAALGYALQRLGETVLVLDMCPENLLRLHLGLGLDDRDGWAAADASGRPWQAGYQLLPTLWLLPYGELDEDAVVAHERRLQVDPGRWAARLAALAPGFDWILVDLPQRLPGHRRAFLHEDGCDVQLLTMNVDPASYVLLQRAGSAPLPRQRLLLNRYDPGSLLQRDLLQLWLDHHGDSIVPQHVHEDAAVGEAMATRQPVGLHAPTSLAAADADSLAVWCLAHKAQWRQRGARR
jgi:cellulose synthase operon protein YhjQ